MKALISGITGQDGSYLAELLLEKGYEVHGIIRRSSTFNTDRIDHIYEDRHEADVRIFLHYGDLNDSSGLRKILEKVQPTEVYNLGAQSHVKVSFDQPEYTADCVALGTLRLLEAVRDYQDRTGQQIRFYQASSSEMFGSSPPPQSETTVFHPRSPYAVAKVAGHHFCMNYREAYGMFICSGILFNHESPRRGETFVTRKITRAVGRIKLGLQKKLYLGNLEARRDWGSPATPWTRCGACCSMTRPTTMWCHREGLQRARVPGRFLLARGTGPEGLRRGRPALLPPLRGGRIAGQQHQGPRETGLGAQGGL